MIEDMWRRAALWVLRGLGLVVAVGTSLAEFGRTALGEAQELWLAIFDIPLEGSETTLGDWLVMAGVADFMTIVTTACLVKLAVLATKATLSILPGI